MAKKVKTPEEVQAAMEKKAAKRTLFFGTFRKALAFFLAIAFTFAMVQIAFTSKTGGTVATGGGTSGDYSSNNGSGGSSGSNDYSGNDDNSNAADNNDVAGNGDTADNNSNNNASDTDKTSKADAISLLNSVTKEAAKAGYDWSRKCYYTDDGALQVKTKNGLDATNILNKAISSFSDSSLDKVVGGFLDITGKDEPRAAKKAKGSAAAPEGMKDKFLLKGMTLTEGDVAKFEKTGDVYKFQLNTCNNPEKNNGNALHRATDDFVTGEQVKNDVAEATKKTITIESVDVQYADIVILAEIKDGKLTSLSLNYLMDVKSLNLKAGISIIGTGKGRVEEAYKNFVY